MSYVVVPAHYARQLAEFYIDTRNHRIRREEEAMIEREMHRRWFAPKTRELARRLLEQTVAFQKISSRGEDGHYAAVDLRNLAIAAMRTSGAGAGKVHLSDRHAWLVDWKPRKDAS